MPIISSNSSKINPVLTMNSNTTNVEQSTAEIIKLTENHYFMQDNKKMQDWVHSKYSFAKLLGEGGSAVVFLTVHIATGKEFACKYIRKGGLNSTDSMDTETAIMKIVNHENIISMFELYETPSSKWIFLEYMNVGNLQNYVANFEKYDESTAAETFHQILRAVDYLHDHGIVHRDLKLENILVTDTVMKQSTVKIVDFGLSALVNLDKKSRMKKWTTKRYNGLKERWGTVEHFAPEVFAQKYGPQVDVWALGCVLIEILIGEKAFKFTNSEINTNPFSFFKTAFGYQYQFQKNEEWNKLSMEAKDLIMNMLQLNPKKRFNVKECLDHPWIKNRGLSASNYTLSKSNTENSLCSISSDNDGNTDDCETSMSTKLSNEICAAHELKRAHDEMKQRRDRTLKWLTLREKQE